MMLVAAPVRHESATSWTGLYEKDVKNSVMKPMAQPPQRPKMTQSAALRGEEHTLPTTNPPTHSPQVAAGSRVIER
jgi:hypothetical protein